MNLPYGQWTEAVPLMDAFIGEDAHEGRGSGMRLCGKITS